MNSVTLATQNSSGVTESLRIELLGMHPHRLACTREDGRRKEYEAGNFFRCLALAREDLEKEGLLLCCQGGRKDVTLSGSQIQMRDGLYAYTFDPHTRAVSQEEVYILDPAPFASVGTVEQQRQAVLALHGLPGSDPQAGGSTT
ncbi:hypothetical protein [Streptomyces sp. 891-h]|uniref:hypothetical protein n=1 Tax=Streptomyces sp. 891-h TaxID=2720714 RepID=UPI001FAA7FB6|nr:hypothetical protein [Streptomyces sp. 891-h]UNZ17797.1 hypothetical protein HC362_12735 [Streptomyces sp. 891-h]